jgi:uncharacterized membrane protein YbhN (UPF0104 family)
VRRRVARVVGTLVGLAGLYYVVRLVLDQRQEAGRLVEEVQPGLLVGALLLGLAGMTIIGLTWNLLLGALDRPLPTRVALRAYFVGQLGKYVPGGVWTIVGRGEWARREGLSGRAAYTSTVLSMATAYLAGCLVTLAVLPTTGGRITHPLALLVAALGVVGVVAAHPAVLRRVLRLAERVTRREAGLTVPATDVMVRAVALQCVTWLCIGTGTWLVGVGLGFDLPFPDVVAATAVSWVIGLLVLPVPGGIGVREGAFVAVLGASGDVAAIAIAARLVAVAVDVLGATVSTLAAPRTTDVTTTEDRTR